MRRLVDPAEVHGGIVLAVALAGIAVNLAATVVLAGANRESLNIRGAFLHVATDLAAFCGTALAGALILATGWGRFDPIASLLVAALMVWAGVGARCATRCGSCSSARPATSTPRRSAARSSREPGVVETHDLHVWTVTSGFPALSAHVLVEQGADCHAAAAAARAAARRALRARAHDAPGRARGGERPRRGRARARRSGAGRRSATAIKLPAWPDSSTAGPRSSPARRAASARATARALAQAGARVAAGARRTDRLEEFELAHELDVTDPESCEAFVAWAVVELGGIDILVNAAGMALGRAPFTESSEEDERAVFETDVNGLVRMTRLCLPHVLDGGHLVNLGSVAGRQAYEGGATYIASKFAVRGFTYALREDLLGRPIRITTVDPGLVETEFSLVRFRGDEEKARAVYAGVEAMTPEDIADCVLFARHAAAARERRRDRREGARPVERRPHPAVVSDRLRIAVLSPVWFPVPPTGYGGIEWIVSLLADGLADAGHDVTLFASGESLTKAKLACVFEHAPSEQIGQSGADLRHALGCYAPCGRVRRDQRPLRDARGRARGPRRDAGAAHGARPARAAVGRGLRARSRR